MTAPEDRRRTRGAETVQRLLDATAEVLSRDGAAGVSVQRIADVAGTSKGLVHYHFPDKDALLAACAEHLTSAIVTIEATALARSTASTALDDLWQAFTATVRGGTRRALASLHTDATPATLPALTDSLRRRRGAAEETIGRLETVLAFHSGVPRNALAIAYVALADGLALELYVRPAADCRPAFDAFWLAVLSVDSA